MSDMLPPDVRLGSSFEEILGKNGGIYQEAERKERWEAWKVLCRRKDPGAVEYWEDDSACQGCIHLESGWCGLQGLPATVNPVLSFRMGTIGMACMGMGKAYAHPLLPFEEMSCL